jgi:cytochrome P450
MFSIAFSVESASVALVISLLSLYYVFFRETRNLPPRTKHNLFELIRNLTEGNEPDFYLQCLKDYGPIFIFSLPQPFVVICDPDLAKKILEEEMEKPSIYKAVDGFTLGIPNLFTKNTHGSDHQKVRKCLAPSFSSANIFSSLPKIHEKIDLLKKIFLQYESDNRSFNVSEIIPRLLMDILCTAMFDVDYHTLEVEDGEGRHLMNDLHSSMKEFAKGLSNPFNSLMFWKKELIDAKAAALRIYQSQKKLLDNYRAKNTPEEIENDVSIMAHLLKTPYKSDMERCADMTTFINAGQDTSSYTIAWILVEVAQHPEIHQKIKEEIACTVGNDVTHMTQQHLSKLVYLDYVIKEGMRLWPVAATGSARIASKDIQFRDMIIPKGFILNMPQYCLNRVGIQDPESFNPDRWSPDSPDLEQLKVSFLPFAVGRRNCIGQNLATFEVKLILATLFRSFRFELQGVVEKTNQLTLRPKDTFLKAFSV